MFFILIIKLIINKKTFIKTLTIILPIQVQKPLETIKSLEKQVDQGCIQKPGSAGHYLVIHSYAHHTVTIWDKSVKQ